MAIKVYPRKKPLQCRAKLRENRSPTGQRGGRNFEKAFINNNEKYKNAFFLNQMVKMVQMFAPLKDPFSDPRLNELRFPLRWLS
ncbi:hypothetical protein TNCV_2713091 [Trichonephila clavipes]|nr:hypothetical protein TNCV_2713091 [Trichonephila clavipes]